MGRLNNRKKIFVFVMVLLLSQTNNCLAQRADTLSWGTLDFTVAANPWLDTWNPAGKTTKNNGAISELQLSFNKTNGAFVDYYESNNSFEAGAAVKSIVRYDDRLVLFGSVGYSHFRGKSMSGSVFLDPYYYPIDILEFDYDKAGEKRKGEYSISGGVAYDIFKGFTIGGNVSLLGANYSKMIDLRHQTSLSDFDLSLGLRYEHKKFAVGVSYNYRQYIEAVSFNRFYDGGYSMYMLLSYGHFWGERKSFSTGVSNAFISTSNLPFLNTTHRASIQLSYVPNVENQMFLQVDYASRNADVGVQEQESPIYNTFSTRYINAKLFYVNSSDDNRHIVKLSYDNEKSLAYENKYRLVNGGTVGSNYIDYLEPIQTTISSSQRFTLGYTAQLMIDRSLPKVEVFANSDMFLSNKSSTIYPYYRNNSGAYFNVKVGAKYNIEHGKHVFSPLLAIEYQDMLYLRTVDDAFVEGAMQKKPSVSDVMRTKNEAYLYSSQMAITPQFSYMYSLPKSLKLTATLGYCFNAPFDSKLGQRHEINAGIGLIF